MNDIQEKEEINVCPVCNTTPAVEQIGTSVCRVQCPNQCFRTRWWLSREQAIEKWNLNTDTRRST